jgi:hypothetical protein
MRPNFRRVGNSKFYFTCCPATGQPDRHAQPVPERAQQDCWRAFRGAEPEEQAQSQQAGRTSFPGNFSTLMSLVYAALLNIFIRDPRHRRNLDLFVNSSTVLRWIFRTLYRGWAASRNRVVVPDYQATNAGGIDSWAP